MKHLGGGGTELGTVVSGCYKRGFKEYDTQYQQRNSLIIKKLFAK